MNKYSPAPWHVESADPKFEGDDRCDVYPPQDLPQGSRIPVAMSIHPENASLIAAAPEMLAALMAAKSELHYFTATRGSEAHQLVLAAIAKATGE